MSLTKCKECGKEIAGKADACPHCGISNPGYSGPGLGCLLLLIGIICSMLAYFDSCRAEKVEKKETQSCFQVSSATCF